MTVASPPTGACRTTAPAEPGQEMVWIQPDDRDERRALDEHCRVVGRPMLAGASTPPAEPASRVVTATWNMHDGRGDLLALALTLRQGLPGE